ncbi:gliding motility-associated C-terminal domain-containing protein [Mucilaginibacter sp.]|uniref:gliding motility-associated C-terminal domain-containing protein n=1 Tax=Mucilaginibacter sp. TaxID=1882438 RepID=UPI002C40A9C5|nr:gliding motility-associated C-terminal domain-containing protein [Mucilaginibacter sp.]HTI59123.1 gliding motility-associated C-terminal domain-containing protein [Mucilaginibacter sp.]
MTLAAANGSATTDYINFNLADQSATGRTIVLLSQLPDLSSNLIIDGTSQAGALFGQSDARVKIATPDAYSAYPIRYIPMTIFNGENLDHVEIYGLYLYDYYDIIISYPDLKPRTGISITGGTNITIGATGKGNLIRGFRNYTIDLENTDNIIIQHNVIGLNDQNVMGNGYDSDGINEVSAPINLYKCNHISLGGNSNEGNTIFVGVFIPFYQQTNNNVLSIKSNNFVVFQDGHTTLFVLGEWYGPLITVSTVFDNNVSFNQEGPLQASANIDISDNLLSGTAASFSFQSINGTVNVTNNYFNVARDGTTDITYAPNSPVLYADPLNIQNSNAQFNIGTNDPTKRNLFNNIDAGIVAVACPNIFIRYNDFKCVSTAAYVNNIPPNSYTLPALVIAGINTAGGNTTVTGTATPNALVDIYSSESCRSQCSIRSYLKTVTADNAGNWQTSIFNLNGIFYASATVNNQTSTFKTFEVNSANVNIQNLRCTNAATITGLKIPTGVSYYWTDENGNVVANTLDLTTTKTGKYHLVLAGGCITSQWFEIDDYRVQIYDAGLTKTNIGCGTNNGAIKGIFVYDPLSEIGTLKWTDAGGTVVGTTTDVSNLAPGSYNFTVTTTDGCSKTYGPVELKGVSAPALDLSNYKLQFSGCDTHSGFVKGLKVTGTGTLKFSWTNEQQQEVATTLDLTDQPAGTYTLHVSDDSQCDPIIHQFVIEDIVGVETSPGSEKITAATCGEANGSITGFSVTGASHYKWTNAKGETVGDKVDLTGVGGGDYQLTVSDDCGHHITSDMYHIDQQDKTNYPDYNVSVSNICPGNNGGAINVTTDALVKSERWVNGSGQTIGSLPQLNNIPPGTYQLYLTDQNNCESLYKTYTVNQITPLQFIQGSAQISDDQCSTSTGSIKNIRINGGLTPYNYTWTNQAGQAISTSGDASGLAAGNYTLTVTDASLCNIISENFEIHDQQTIVQTPSADNIQVCSPGEVLLVVNHPVASDSYNLYDADNGAVPLARSVNGKFNINVAKNTILFISASVGNCESQRVAVEVTVGITALNIATAFTPNGDGINDNWNISGIENYPNATVQIFTRYGQKVFESRGYEHPFDGTHNGKVLPVGTYYYIINLNSNCNLLSGSLAIIR